MTSSKRDILTNITLVYCLVARAEAFVSTDRIRRQRPIEAPAKFPLFTTAFNDDDDDDTPPQQRWLDKGLLLSSFTDGLETNPEAQDWLCDALIENLWKERQQSMEISLSKSNEFSPCNGPDIALFEKLEDTDKKVKELYPNDDEETSTAVKCTSSWRQSLKWLVQPREKDDPLELRLVYVPTALYALRRDSNNTPGKQRQRARADGKKRRDAVVRMLADRLLGRDGDVTIASVTLDLDDGSIKQPESTGDDGVDFPRSGKEAIQDWKPHLIYVQGGNTFWLHHCMEKGDWGDALIESCCTNESDEHQSKAVYIGVSAGAILIGNSMQTACWKVRIFREYAFLLD
jgi:hypothetical protein